jgi:hypothetical protein
MNPSRRNPRTVSEPKTTKSRTRVSPHIDQELEQLAAAEQQTTVAEVRRSKLGWQIRVDLKKACQQIALDNDLKDYEVLEMLLDEALAARARRKVEK